MEDYLVQLRDNEVDWLKRNEKRYQFHGAHYLYSIFSNANLRISFLFSFTTLIVQAIWHYSLLLILLGSTFLESWINNLLIQVAVKLINESLRSNFHELHDPYIFTLEYFHIYMTCLYSYSFQSSITYFLVSHGLYWQSALWC